MAKREELGEERLFKSACLSALTRVKPARVELLASAMRKSAFIPFSVFGDSSSTFKIVFSCGSSICISDIKRIHFYKFGLTARLNYLMSSYFLDQIDFSDGDCIVDCGANIAEVGMALSAVRSGLDYVGIEPARREFLCARKNLPDGTHINLALWNAATTMTLYEKSDTADSSLIEFEGFHEQYEVQAIPLDEVESILDRKFIKLLKIEGEGAEPEIIEGAFETLKKVNYVSVDCGPERGLRAENTLPAAANLLYEKGFKLLAVHPNRLTALFENQNL